jgi:hypothetical protein
MACGYPEPEFWNCTPLQANLAFKAAKLRFNREHNESAWHAYHVAAMSRAKKIPKLEKLLIREQARKPQTWQEMRSMVRVMNAMFGGRDLKRDKARDH